MPDSTPDGMPDGMPDVTPGRPVSLWREGRQAPEHPPLDGDRTCDVAVVGGGITGVTTALLLARAGRSVCLVDLGRIGSGTTGGTTAKVTSQHNLTYASLRRSQGRRGAAAYAAANQAGVEMIAELGSGLDCDLRRRDMWVWAGTAGERAKLDLEAEVARSIGLPASVHDDVPLPFATAGGLRFTDQLEVQPVAYLDGLVAELVAAGGEVFEQTTATGVQEHSGSVTVETTGGTLTADHVVVATLMPFLDRGLQFARAHPMRSYVVTAKVRGQTPVAGFINAGSPVRSLRSVPHDGGELLMVGGESHHVGSHRAGPERYRALAEFAQEHWDVSSFEHRWSAQDYMPVDGVPYVGLAHPLAHRTHVVTGLRKWGLSNGTAAAMMISDAILGRANPWARFFSARRLRPLAGARKFVTENGRVGFRMVGDRVTERGERPIDELGPGEGAIVNLAGEKVAGYRDDGGTLHAASARCTHLGCQVAWNGAERSWDCPCHGSRFSPDGSVLCGPATRPLGRRV